MEMKHYLYLLMLLFVMPEGESYKPATCTPPHNCKTVRACGESHPEGYLDGLVLFQCGRGYLCCPPNPKNSSSLEENTTTRKWTKQVERTTEWNSVFEPPSEDFYSESTTQSTSLATHAVKHAFVAHKNMYLLPEGCGMSLSNKIVGGQDTAVAEFPWMALIGFKGENGVTGFVCGGTLISNRYVLTAAHCLYRENAILSHVRLGEFDLTKEEDCNGEECFQPAVDIPVQKVIPHEKYSNTSYRNDIALLRLNSSALELGLSTISPICLPFNVTSLKLIDGYKYEAAGWGLTGWRESSLSNTLKKTVLGGINLTACNAAVCPKGQHQQPFCPLQPSQICVQGVRRRDVCKGDSGGPLMSQNHIPIVQVGLTSFKTTEVCGEDDIPTIFTRIDSYIKWILDNMEP